MRLLLVGPSILTTVLLSLTLFAPSTHGLVSLKQNPIQYTAQLAYYQTSPRHRSSRHYMFNAFGGTKTATAKPASSSSAPAVYDLVRTKISSHTRTRTDQCNCAGWRMWSTLVCVESDTYSSLYGRHSILVLFSLWSLLSLYGTRW
jgi:hypothetical protein